MSQNFFDTPRMTTQAWSAGWYHNVTKAGSQENCSDILLWKCVQWQVIWHCLTFSSWQWVSQSCRLHSNSWGREGGSKVKFFKACRDCDLWEGRRGKAAKRRDWGWFTLGRYIGVSFPPTFNTLSVAPKFQLVSISVPPCILVYLIVSSMWTDLENALESRPL